MATAVHVCGTGSWAGPVAGDPSNVTGLTAVGTFGGIKLVWQYPALNPFALAHTRLYRSTLAEFGTATLLQIVDGGGFFDRHDEDDLGAYHYWIEGVSVNGTVGEVFGPASASALPSIPRTLELLSGKINNSLLAQELRTEIERIGTLYNSLGEESSTRAQFNAALSQALAAVQSEVVDAKTLILTEATQRSDNYTALVSTLNIMAAGVADNAAAIAQEQIVRANELEAIAQELLALTASSGTDSAAALQQESTARATADSALASQITTAQSSLNGSIAAVQTALQTDIQSVNGKVTEIGARYTVKVNVNGLVGGFGIYNDGTSVDAGFDVDTFYIGKGTGTKKKPFIVTDGVVWIDGAVINKLTANQIDTRGITVKDADGNILLGAGTGLDFSNVTGTSKPANGATRNVFKGSWATGASYVAGDIVLDGAGYGWSCVLGHTSSASLNTPAYPTNSNTYWTLYVVKGGSSLVALLSNDSHTFPADYLGAVAGSTGYVGSGTTISVYEGSDELVYDGVGTANGTWKVTATGTSITPGTVTDSGNFATVAQHSSVSNTSDTASVLYAIVGKTKAGAAFSINKYQTFTKAKAGIGGEVGPQGPSLVVTSSKAATFTATDGTLDASQSNITFTAAVSGVATPSYVWSFTGFQTAPSNSGTSTLAITQAQFGTAKFATVTCTVNGVYIDTVTVVRLEKSTAAAGATVGAPTGTLVGSTLAQNVESVSGAQAKADAAKLAVQAYADAQDAVSRATSAAYADGIVSDEEARAIADATAKAETARIAAVNAAAADATAKANVAATASADNLWTGNLGDISAGKGGTLGGGNISATGITDVRGGKTAVKRQSSCRAKLRLLPRLQHGWPTCGLVQRHVEALRRGRP